MISRYTRLRRNSVKFLNKAWQELQIFFQKKIVTTLVTYFLLVSIVPIFVLSFFWYKNSSQHLSELGLRNALNETEVIADEIEYFLNEIESDVRFLSKIPPFEEISKSNEQRRKYSEIQTNYELWIHRLELILNNFAQEKKIYSQLRFINELGKEVVRINYDQNKTEIISKSMAQNKKHRPYFQKTMKLNKGVFYISELNLNREHNQIEMPFTPVIRYALPIFNKDGSRQGIIVANILAEHFLKLVKTTQGSLFLLNSDGYYLKHPDRHMEWGFDLGHKANLKHDLPEIFATIKSKNTFGSHDNEAHQIYTHARVHFDKYNKGRYWTVFKTVNDNVIYSSLANLRNGVFITSIFLIFILIFLGILLARRISRPILKLSQISKEISSGIYTSNIEVGVNNEIGVLADSFRNMATSLIDSNQYIDKIIATMPSSLLVINPKKEILMMNQKSLELLEYTKQELIGKPIETILTKGSSSNWNSSIEDLATDGSINNIEISYKTKSGKSIPIAFSATMMKNDEGVPQAIIGVAKDMREIRHTMKELSRLASFPENNPNPIVEIRSDGKIIYNNPAAKELLPNFKLIMQENPDFLKDLNKICDRLKKDKYKLYENEIVIKHLIYEQQISYIPETKSARIYFIDRTERKLLDKLERLDNIKDEFISSTSHEIRTPLAIIKSAIDILKEGIAGPLTNKQMEFVYTTSRNIDRLNRVVNKLLDLSRLESGKVKLNYSLFSMQKLIDELILSFNQKAKLNNVTLENNLHNAPPYLHADIDMLSQILINLIDNALKYAKNKVAVQVYSSGPLIHISVTDDGEGISPDNIKKIFNRFEQINRPLGGGGYKGTGLGLAICKDIADLHKGKIWATSTLGKGTQIHLTLPIKKA